MPMLHLAVKVLYPAVPMLHLAVQLLHPAVPMLLLHMALPMLHLAVQMLHSAVPIIFTFQQFQDLAKFFLLFSSFWPIYQARKVEITHFIAQNHQLDVALWKGECIRKDHIFFMKFWVGREFSQ